MNAEFWETFRADALKDSRLEGHPKADWAYALAWKTGWEGGPREVMVHLRGIAEMIFGEQNVEVSKKR